MKRLWALLLALLLVLPGCEQRPQLYEAIYTDVFDTITVFKGYADSRQAFDQYAQAAHDELVRLHRLFDIYNTYPGLNNLMTVNRLAGQGPVAVETDILDLLALGQAAHADSGGAVNIAMGAVTALWRQARENPAGPRLPDADALVGAMAHCDISGLAIDRQAGTVALLDAGMSLDVGAIAKGWAAGRAIEAAQALGMTSGVLSAGGNVVTLGTPADGREAWLVGIQDPSGDEDADQALLGAVAVADLSVVSSGDYQRYFTLDGVRYHHIIDPETGYPGVLWRAVTVVGPDSGLADMLSTALFLLPRAEGEALLLKYNAQALWVNSDGTVVTSAGFPPLTQ